MAQTKKKNQKTGAKSRSARLCLSCNKIGFKNDTIIMQSYRKPVGWKKRLGLKTKFPGDRKPTTLRSRTPKDARHGVKIELGKRYANRWVLYYAAQPSSGSRVSSPAVAYGSKFPNQGMVKTDSLGSATLKLHCPQRYREKQIIFPRHVHFLVNRPGKNNTQWSDKLYTVGIRCN